MADHHIEDCTLEIWEMTDWHQLVDEGQLQDLVHFDKSVGFSLKNITLGFDAHQHGGTERKTKMTCGQLIMTSSISI